MKASNFLQSLKGITIERGISFKGKERSGREMLESVCVYVCVCVCIPTVALSQRLAVLVAVH